MPSFQRGDEEKEKKLEVRGIIFLVLGGREYVGYQYYMTGCRKEVALLYADAEWLSNEETSQNTGYFLFTFSIEMLYYVPIPIISFSTEQKCPKYLGVPIQRNGMFPCCHCRIRGPNNLIHWEKGPQRERSSCMFDTKSNTTQK